MERHKLFVLAGLVMVIVGIVLLAVPFLVLTDDPSEGAVESFQGPATQVVTLDKGEYDVWASGELVTVTIHDTVDNEVFSGPGDTFDIINGEFYRLGTFEIDSGGDYEVNVDGYEEVWITDPIDIGSTLVGGICGGFVVLGVGGVLMLVGLIMWLSSRKERPQPYAQQPYAQQPYAQQPYAQQPYAQQPYAQQPYPQQPYPQQPYPQQPYPQQPYPQQPPQQPPQQQPPRLPPQGQ